MSTCADGTMGTAAVPLCPGALESGVIIQQVGDRNSISPPSVIFNGVSVNTPTSIYHNGTPTFLSSTGHVLFSGMNVGLQPLACRSAETVEMNSEEQDKRLTVSSSATDAASAYPSFHCSVNGMETGVKVENASQEVSGRDRAASISLAFSAVQSDGVLHLDGYSLGAMNPDANGTSLLSNKLVLPLLQLPSSSSPSSVTQGESARCDTFIENIIPLR